MKHLELIFLWLFVGAIFWTGANITPLATQSNDLLSPKTVPHAQALAATPVFRYPVVAEVEISSYFDHDARAQVVTFYNSRSNKAGVGFLFSCPVLDDTLPGAGNTWIGCEIAANGEANCPDDRELWYDNHHGLDYEYTPNWRTGSQCDPARFGKINPPIYAPAQGIVETVGANDPFNGNFILLYHDLNGDRNFYNDGLRSFYLHFTDNGIVVDEGQIVQVGDLLGYGGMTGLAWTPHLHFEVQRRTQSGWQPVDPFGWTGPTNDPWVVPNYPLWNEDIASATP